MRFARKQLDRAPEFSKDAVWLNGEPLTMASLRGRVVLIDFWTYSCVNCVRTIPKMNAWFQAFRSARLVVIGVHAPEFSFEKDIENVRRAIREQNVQYPVVLDNDFALWRAYKNRYWPHAFLIDHEGNIVYDHVGEGGEEEMGNAIRHALLASGVSDVPEFHQKDSGSHGVCYRATPEVYLGYLRGNIGNADDCIPETECAFLNPESHALGVPYLHGHWRMASEYVEHTRTTPVATEFLQIRYQAYWVNLVLGALDDREAVVTVLLDGKPVPASLAGEDVVIDAQGNTHLHVTHHRMYRLIRGDHFHEATLRLAIKPAGVKVYAFTFGGCV